MYGFILALHNIVRWIVVILAVLALVRAYLGWLGKHAGQPSIDRAKSGWGVPGLKSQWPLIPQTTDFQKQAYKVLQDELGLNTPPIQFNPFVGETVVPDAWSKNLDQALKGEITFDDLLANIESEVNLSMKESIDRIMG